MTDISEFVHTINRNSATMPYPRIDLAYETVPLVAVVHLHTVIDETGALLQIVEMLHPDLFRVATVLHLALQEVPQLRGVALHKRQRSVVRATEVARLVEAHRCSDVHVAGVDQQRPAGRAFHVQHGEIVHVERLVVDLEQQRIVGAIANATADGQCFVVVPIVVARVDFRFPQIDRAEGGG